MMFFHRNCLSMGGREVFVHNTLAGHVNSCHKMRTGKDLVFIKPRDNSS